MSVDLDDLRLPARTIMVSKGHPAARGKPQVINDSATRGDRSWSNQKGGLCLLCVSHAGDRNCFASNISQEDRKESS